MEEMRASPANTSPVSATTQQERNAAARRAEERAAEQERRRREAVSIFIFFLNFKTFSHKPQLINEKQRRPLKNCLVISLSTLDEFIYFFVLHFQVIALEMRDNLLNHFKLISKIGEGSFSEVLKVKEKKSGNFYAAKRLTRPFLTFDEMRHCAELKILQKLEYHPNILSLVDFVYESQSGALTLILDLMDMSLYDFIKNRTKALPESRCKTYMFQLAQGLFHLHRNGIFHRDIKPENILIRTNLRLKKNNPSKSELIQIGDLGSVCQTNFSLPHSAYISTRWYRAPECLLTSGFYGPKMDIWALGCCFYEILTLNPLFPGKNEIDQLNKIHGIVGSPSEKLLERFKHRNLDYDFPKKKSIGFHKLVPGLSDYGVDIMKKMLVYCPDVRISAKKMLDHLYFQDHRCKSRISTSTSRLLMSSSLTTSTPEVSRSSKSPKSTLGMMSLNNSRGSLNSTRDSTLSKLQEAQEKLHKQLERGWGMNSCPKKENFCNIKSTVKTFQGLRHPSD